MLAMCLKKHEQGFLNPVAAERERERTEVPLKQTRSILGVSGHSLSWMAAHLLL